MEGELYRLPGRHSQRRRIWAATLAGLLAAATGGITVASQWIALVDPGLRGGPALVEPGSSAARWMLAASAALFGVWAVGWTRGRGGPRWWTCLMAGLVLAAAAVVPIQRPDAVWSRARSAELEEPVRNAAAAGGAAVFAALGLGIGAWSRRALERVPKGGETHGSAHYASAAEVAAAGFLSEVEDGVVLGSFEGRRLRSLKDQHVLLFSPPGAGKSTALAVPTLLTWRGSVFVLDAKSELFNLTAAYRQRALENDVCRVDFTATARDLEAGKRPARLNPLLSIPRGDREVAEAQAVAELLVGQREQGGGGDGFWRERAQEMLVALMLHTLYCERRPTLARCRERLREGPIDRLLAEMILTEHDLDREQGWNDGELGSTRTHPEVAGTARSLLGMAEETRSGVVAHAEQALRLFGDPRLAENTSTTDVTASDLMDRERPVSLYLTLPGGEVDRLEPMLRLVLSQWLRELLNRRVATDPGELPYRHRLLLLLDEFPLLGKMKFLEKAGAALRGYGIQLFVIVQSVTQLKAIYGNQETISGICPIHLTMGATDLETAKRISERLGKITVETERSSVATAGPSRKTLSEAEHGRPLLAPDEVARLPEDRLLVLPLGHAPILGQRVPYFRDPEMASRVEAGAGEEVHLARFAHDWSCWTERRVQRPEREEISKFLGQWKRTGVTRAPEKRGMEAIDVGGPRPR